MAKYDLSKMSKEEIDYWIDALQQDRQVAGMQADIGGKDMSQAIMEIDAAISELRSEKIKRTVALLGFQKD